MTITLMTDVLLVLGRRRRGNNPSFKFGGGGPMSSCGKQVILSEAHVRLGSISYTK